jgi:hypothetical protein
MYNDKEMENTIEIKSEEEARHTHREMKNEIIERVRKETRGR